MEHTPIEDESLFCIIMSWCLLNHFWLNGGKTPLPILVQAKVETLLLYKVSCCNVNWPTGRTRSMTSSSACLLTCRPLFFAVIWFVMEQVTNDYCLHGNKHLAGLGRSKTIQNTPSTQHGATASFFPQDWSEWREPGNDEEFIDFVILALQVCLFSATMAPEILDMTTILGWNMEWSPYAIVNERKDWISWISVIYIYRYNIYTPSRILYKMGGPGVRKK